AFAAVHDETRPGLAGEHSGAQHRTPVRIVQDDVECVVGCSALAFVAHVGCDCERLTEKQQRLINEVRSEIKEDAAARLSALAPCARTQLGTVSFKVRFKEHHSPQTPLADQCANGAEVTIPSPIVEDGEQAPGLLGEPRQLSCFFVSGGKGLVDDDIAVALKTLRGYIVMRGIRRGDDDEVDALDSEHLVEAADDTDFSVA